MTLGRPRHLPQPLRTLLLSLFLFSLVATPLQAQDPPFPFAKGQRALVLVPLGLGMSLLGEALAEGFDPLTPEAIRALDPAEVNPFDRTATNNWSPAWAQRSDRSLMLLMGATIILVGGEAAHSSMGGRGPESAILMTMLGEATLFTLGATYMTKGMAGRRRPYVFNPALSVEERFHIAQVEGDDLCRNIL